jgi:ketosteroid isomerase-like protein
MKFQRWFLPLLLVTSAAAAEPPLAESVAALDAAFFAAYNTCDLVKFGSLIAEDVEFYHDQGGITRGRQALVDSVKNNICGKTRRELVAGTMQVYPMRGFGAVQTGDHRFFPIAKDSAATGVAKFIHLWQKKDGGWLLTRVISFDHRALPLQ